MVLNFVAFTLRNLSSEIYYFSYFLHTLCFTLFQVLFNSLLIIIFCSLLFSNDDEAHNKKNNSNEFTSIDSDMYDHRFNNWLLTFEDILGSFNLEEKQKNILKMLIKK